MRDFTVKDLAELLGVSKPTIQRAINAAAIEADREDGQTRYYSFDTAAAISAKVKPEFDFLGVVGGSDVPPHDATQTETPQNDAKHTATTPPNDATQTATPPQADSMEFMRAMLSTIQEQLAAKDRQIAAYEAQIAVKDEQIRDYSERLKEAMLLTKGQQYIAAADKTAGLLEAAANQEEEVIVAAAAGNAEEPVEPAKKKGFWQKLFGRE